MHRYLVVILLVPAACGIQLPDPCADTSPLQVDPKVKEACEAMAETGGEAGDYVCVTPYAYEDKYSLCVPNNYDNNFHWASLTKGSLAGSTIDHRNCSPIVQYQAWASPNKAQLQPDYICMNTDSVTYSSPDGHAFALLERDEAWGYMRSLPEYGWNDTAMTQATVLGVFETSVMCPKGVLCATAMADCFCNCENDSDCSALTRKEAVCELGMCFYVDEPAAPSGLQPGPPAYGLQSWSEGIRIQPGTAANHITITPAFFAALVPGVLRDDQSFNAVGTIAHCGRVSLCGHLGLMVGDTAVFDDDVVDDLMAGETVMVEVIHADGSDRTFTVKIDFDGDLDN